MSARSRLVTSIAVDLLPSAGVPMHRHPEHQLVFAESGVVVVHGIDRAWIVPPTRAVWIPGGVDHGLEAREIVALRTIYVDPALGDAHTDECRVVAVTPLLRELILSAVKLPPRYDPDGPDGRLLSVLVDQLHAAQNTPTELSLPREQRLRKVVDGLLADPSDSRTLDEWAGEAGMSGRTLARAFRKTTGMTFGDWRQQLRILVGLSRLAEGHSVTTVAYDLGYASPSAFITMFKRAMGEPPIQYMRHAPGA